MNYSVAKKGDSYVFLNNLTNKQTGLNTDKTKVFYLPGYDTYKKTDKTKANNEYWIALYKEEINQLYDDITNGNYKGDIKQYIGKREEKKTKGKKR